MKYLRYIALALSILMLFTLVGCANKKPVTTEGAETSKPAQPSVTPSVSEKPSIPETSIDQPVKQKLQFDPKVTSSENGNIVVSIELSGNEAIAGYGISLIYDHTVLEHVSQTYEIAGVYSTTNVKTPGRVCLMCTVAGGNGITENGIINTVTFKLKEGVTPEKLHFEIKTVDELDIVYTFDVESGSSETVDCVFGKTDYTLG